jgi:hypothetical protein
MPNLQETHNIPARTTIGWKKPKSFISINSLSSKFVDSVMMLSIDVAAVLEVLSTGALEAGSGALEAVLIEWTMLGGPDHTKFLLKEEFLFINNFILPILYISGYKEYNSYKLRQIFPILFRSTV